VDNATFTNNIVKNVAGAAVNLLGKDNEAESSYIEPSTGRPKCGDAGEVYGSIRGTNATFANNVFDNVGGAFLQLNGFDNVVMYNNTHRQRGNLMTLFGDQSNGFKYVDNVTEDHDYCVFADGGLQGVDALAKFTPDAVVTSNTIAAPTCKFPAGNNHPLTLVIGSDYRTPYTGDGANIDAILAAQAGVIAGPTVAPPSPSPNASPTVLPSPTATASVLPSPTATQPLPSPSPSIKPSPSPSPVPLPSPVTPCGATSWPPSVAGQNSQMSTRRAQGCYPVRRTNNGMEYTRP
jgi:hypothetical protein